MPNPVRVRFAPSPTGPLHVGGLRTALYNYLLAKKNGGSFILRIEDTDTKREVEGSYKYIEEALNWCGLPPDESPSLGGEYGPYKQSDRKGIYKEYINELIENGSAYYAFDKVEDLDKHRKNHEKRGKTFIYNAHNRLKLVNSLSLKKNEVEDLLKTTPYVVRFKMPEEKVIDFYDEIRGEIEVSSRELDDKVLFKSDQMPTYHFANVVDDHLMNITHVIRGEEWLPSLPLHVLLYKSFGWSPPSFAHIPLILKPSGKGKLSKRDGKKFGFPVFPLEWENGEEKFMGFKGYGILPEALINYMALLGWSKKDNKEFYFIDELIDSFDINSVGKSGAKFDFEKLIWLNAQHIQKLSSEDIVERESKLGEGNGLEISKGVVELIKSRLDRLGNIKNDYSYLFGQQEVDPVLKNKLINDDSLSFLRKYKTALEKSFGNAEELKSLLNVCSTIGFSKSMGVMRLCLVGRLAGPDLFELMVFLGKDEVLKRVGFILD
jgi:glutamyl-tRNA synthetase